MKELRCNVCGEVDLEENLEDYAVNEGYDSSNRMCTTCDEVDNFTEIEEEEEEMVECTCIYCGDDFEAEYEKEVCEECNEAIEEASNPALIVALAEEFGCAPKDIGEHGDGEFDIDGVDYLVLTDSEADDKVEDYIEDTLWAFSPNFLASVTGVDESVFVAIQDNGNCESNNEPIQSILDATNTDMSEVAREAISWDGRGHFLSQYDGQETEVYADGEYYYCYRQ